MTHEPNIYNLVLYRTSVLTSDLSLRADLRVME